MRKALLLVSFTALLAACGDNNNNGDDDDDVPTIDAAVPDSGAPDAMPCPARGFGEIGGGCTVPEDCETAPGNGQCLVGQIGQAIFPPQGYCTVFSGCTTDDECGTGNVCTFIADFGATACLPACGECGGTTCSEGQACFDSLNGIALDQVACVPGDAGARDGDECLGFYECDEVSACFRDALEFPSGQCAEYGCTVGNDATCNGGHCVDVTGETPLSGTLCVDGCTEDADCRMFEGYECFDPGNGDDSYCRHPHIGDACGGDPDCGGSFLVCLTGATFPGGYCTQGCATAGATTEECTAGAVCADPLVGTSYCTDRCETVDIGTQGRCRTGYVCLDVDPSGAVTTAGCVAPGSI